MTLKVKDLFHILGAYGASIYMFRDHLHSAGDVVNIKLMLSLAQDIFPGTQFRLG